MPSRFRFPRITRSEQLWIPLAQDPLFGGWTGKRAGHWLQVTGRLKPGVTTTQARAELNAIGTRLAEEFPAENSGWVARMAPLQDLIVGNVRSVLLVLLSVVGLVLLIACANIANLLLLAPLRARKRSQSGRPSEPGAPGRFGNCWWKTWRCPDGRSEWASRLLT